MWPSYCTIPTQKCGLRCQLCKNSVTVGSSAFVIRLGLLCKDWIHRSLLFPATWAAQLLLSQCLPTWQSFKKGSHFWVWHFLSIGFVYFVKPSFTASLSCGCVHGFGGNGLSKADVKLVIYEVRLWAGNSFSYLLG